MSASYHMLSAPDAPAPTAIARSAQNPMTGWMWPGAITMPVNAVNTTRDMTRGFSSATIIADGCDAQPGEAGLAVRFHLERDVGHSYPGTLGEWRMAIGRSSERYRGTVVSPSKRDLVMRAGLT